MTLILLAHNSIGYGTNEWNPDTILPDQRVGIEIDTRKAKVGDNVTTWENLPYSELTEGQIVDILISVATENRQIRLAGYNAIGFGSDEWNPFKVLLLNQIGIEMNTRRIKIGNASQTWQDLPYSQVAMDDVIGLIEELALLQPKAVSYAGYSATLGKVVDLSTVEATLAELLDLSYIAPTVTLAGVPAVSVREKGDTIASLALTATTHKTLNNITSVQFFRDSSLIYNVPTPTPGGGAQPYTYSTPFADTTAFKATVGDGTGASDSNTLTYTFVYPYYYGSGAQNLTAAQVAALTKNIVVESTSKAVTYTASNQVFYFAYPASYGVLTSILDPNGFEIISGFTLRVETITGLDGNAVSYNIYELDNPVTQTNYVVTFKQ